MTNNRYLSRKDLVEVRAEAFATKDDGGAEGYWAGRVLQVFTALDELKAVAIELNHALNDVLDAYPYADHVQMPVRRRATDALLHHATVARE